MLSDPQCCWKSPAVRSLNYSVGSPKPLGAARKCAPCDVLKATRPHARGAVQCHSLYGVTSLGDWSCARCAVRAKSEPASFQVTRRGEWVIDCQCIGCAVVAGSECARRAVVSNSAPQDMLSCFEYAVISGRRYTALQTGESIASFTDNGRRAVTEVLRTSNENKTAESHTTQRNQVSMVAVHYSRRLNSSMGFTVICQSIGSGPGRR